MGEEAATELHFVWAPEPDPPAVRLSPAHLAHPQGLMAMETVNGALAKQGCGEGPKGGLFCAAY